MSVRRWASQDLVLAAFCVAAITLGLWPNEPTRQMIHSRDLDGNTSSYSLRTDDSRLARLTRELARRQNPRPTVEISIAKWRIGLANHYARHLDPATGRGAISVNSDANPSTATASGADASSTSSSRVPVVQVGFSPDTQANLAANSTASAVSAQSQELAFWHEISQKSAVSLDSAERQAAEDLAKFGPPAIVLGNVFQPSKSVNAWVTAILLGLIAYCIFADWTIRSPAIVINRDVDSERSGRSETAVALQDTVRLQIPVEWIRIHQPISVQSRRWTLVGLVLTAFATNLV